MGCRVATLSRRGCLLHCTRSNLDQLTKIWLPDKIITVTR
jgi:hypothetical protein